MKIKRGLSNMVTTQRIHKSLEDFVSFMKTYNKGNDYSGEQYRDGEYLITPMLKIKLVIKVL